VRADPLIKGITIYKCEYKISQYADDTCLYLDGSEQSLNQALFVLEQFEIVSGLRVNYSKSKVFKIGSLIGTENNYSIRNNVVWSRGPIDCLGIVIPLENKNAIFDLNYIPKINSTKTLLNIWSMRNLSLAGKITVLKSLVLPKFTYLTSVLPNPPERFVHELDNITYKFLWSNKGDKIKRSTITNILEFGGLQAPSFKGRCASSKIAWVKRLCKSSNNLLKRIYNYLLAPVGGLFVFNCNLKCDDIPCHFKVFPFLYDMLFSWCKLNYKDHPKLESDCIVWNNSHMTVAGKPLYYRELHQKNVNLVSQFSKNGMLMRHEDFCTRHNFNVNFIRYYSVIQVISQYIKYRNMTITLPLNTHLSDFYKLVFNASNVSNTVYWLAIQDTLTMPKKAISAWSIIFGVFDEITWRKIFILPYKCTIEVNCRMFQFKLLHRVIFTNKILKKMGKVPSELCNFCKLYNDCLFHRFWECSTTMAFWRNFSLWFFDNFNTEITLDAMSVFFGYSLNTENLLLEHLIILAKKYINSCFIVNKYPTIYNYSLIVEQVREIEDSIARKKGVLHKHIEKWKV